MNDKDLTPDLLEVPRYGVGMTGALGLFDTAGWPASGQYVGFDDGGTRRDYGPKGCAGIVVGAVAFLIVFAVVTVAVVVGAVQ